MPKDQTSNTRSKPSLPTPYPDPSGNRRGGNDAHDGRITKAAAIRRAGMTVETMLPAPFEEGPVGQPPLTNPDIAHLGQSFFEGAHHFRMRDFQHFNVTVNPPPNLEPLDGV